MQRWLLVTCVLFMSALLAMLAAAVAWTYGDALEKAHRELTELTRATEAQLTRILEQSDLLLMEQRDIALSTDWDDPSEVRAVNERLARRVDVLSYIFRLFIVAADGQVRASSMGDGPALNASDRAYFQAQQSADHGLVISSALNSKASGDPIIVFSRRITSESDTFGGVAVVSFNLQTLAQFFRSVPTSYEPLIQLVADDMEILLSTPSSADTATFVPEHERDIIRQSDAGSAVYAPRDGVERIWSFRSLAPYPLLVRASIPKAVVVRNWLNDTLPFFLVGGLALTGLVVLSAVAIRRARSEDGLRIALFELSKQLENRVKERTASLERANNAYQEAIASLREKSRTLEAISRINSVIAQELDLERLVQHVTDAATEVTRAQFGAFFYNVTNESGDSYSLYALSGVPREAFSKFPMPRPTGVFHPTFAGLGLVRSDDITKDERYGRNEPYYGMPEGHLPVRSYLAVPVISRHGEVLGGLFFGHGRPGVFTDRAEEIVTAIASQASIAYEKASLYRAAQIELAQRAEVEKALRSSEARFRQLAESMPQIVWTAMPDGWPDYYNRKWYEYTGIPDGALRNWRGVLHPDDVTMTREAWRRSLAASEPCEIEYRLQDHTGVYRWHLGRAVPIRDAAGKVIHWFATCTDIDDLKQAETDLANQRDQLAAQAVELSKALKDREILFKEVHHRVKNNLQVISSLVNVQSARIEDETAKAALEDTDHRVTSIALVHEVLYGGHEVTDLDIPSYLGRLCEHLSRAYATAERGISIEVSGEGSLDLIRAVPLALLANELVTNALKHAFPDQRPGRVRVQYLSGQECTLLVADDGVGMRTDARPGGAGNLGMTIIAALATQLEGRIHRGDGPGTEWRVTFAG